MTLWQAIAAAGAFSWLTGTAVVVIGTYCDRKSHRSFALTWGEASVLAILWPLAVWWFIADGVAGRR